ncbi:3-hydroxyacyl-CoA dehydrogenase, domain family, partial [Reticulomyxa filosa]
VPGISPAKAKKIKKVGVIGCGTMGGGILMNFVQIGIPVVVLESKQEFLDNGMAIIRRNWMSSVKKRKLSPTTFEKYMSMIKPTTQYKDFSDVDLVIEAVFENMKIKKEVFRNLDAVCKPSCILATNTSFLDVGEIAKSTSRPQKVVGTHFFAPANVMQLLENVRHPGTDEETIATVQELAKQIKKKGVLVKVCEGFVGNRMFGVEQIEVLRVVLEGATPQQVDSVMYKFGWAMGPFQVGDLSGNDIGYRRRDELGLVEKPFNGPLGEYSPFFVTDNLVKQYNRLGLKTGKGWYDYEDGQRKPIPSKQVEELIIASSKERGITRRK